MIIIASIKIKPVEHPDRIINYWKKEKLVVILIIIFGLAFNISIVLGPIYQGKLIDSILLQDNLNSLLNLVSIYLGLIAMIQILRYFKRFYIRRFANSTSTTLRFMIFNHIMHQDIAKVDNENAGNLMTRAISDVDLCVEGMRKFTTEVFDTGVLMVTYIVAMFIYDYKITLLSLIFIPVAMILAEKLKTLIYKYSSTYRSKSSYISNITYDSIENIMLYRSNGIEDRNREKYEKELDDLKNKAVKANILENSMQPIYNIIGMLGIIFVIYLGAQNVINDIWSIGVFSTYITIFTAMGVKTSKAAKLFNSVQKSQVSWKRIKPYLTPYYDKDTSSHVQENENTLMFNNLSFIYPNSHDYVINNLSFAGNKGEIVGITGPIASGKSTLGKVILGLYPYFGSIKIYNKELSDYSEFERSQIVSYLGHKAELLSDTIYNNITLGNNKDIKQVLSDVCFDEDLDKMPYKEQTLVGNNGVRLSGGQQARIALARTLLNMNKIIILDDPFSAVDMKTEEKIINNLKTNYKDSLVILISHRLSIFPSLDKIIFLNSDKSYFIGTHEELFQTSNLYQTIYNLQETSGDRHE